MLTHKNDMSDAKLSKCTTNIISAVYGIGADVQDVTKALLLAIIPGDTFTVENALFGGLDPAPYRLKRLVLTLVDGTQVTVQEHATYTAMPVVAEEPKKVESKHDTIPLKSALYGHGQHSEDVTKTVATLLHPNHVFCVQNSLFGSVNLAPDIPKRQLCLTFEDGTQTNIAENEYYVSSTDKSPPPNCLLVLIVPLLAEYGPHIERFVNSFLTHKAGANCDLLVVYKHNDVVRHMAMNEQEIWTMYMKTDCLKHLPHVYIIHRNDGYDIGSYIDVGNSTFAERYQYVTFIGSTTVIHCDDWLKRLQDCMAHDPNVTFVGTTANYGNVVPGMALNVHIRSGPIFLVDRSAFQKCMFEPVHDKAGGYKFEHGPHQLGLRMERMGHSCVVARVKGMSYYKAQWMNIQHDRDDVIASDQWFRGAIMHIP